MNSSPNLPANEDFLKRQQEDHLEDCEAPSRILRFLPLLDPWMRKGLESVRFQVVGVPKICQRASVNFLLCHHDEIARS